MKITEKELSQIQEEGIITLEQLDLIKKKFEKKENLNLFSNITNIISILGASVGGLGVMLYIAANWDDFTNLQKTIGAFLFTSLFLFAGGILEYKNVYQKISTAFLLLGSILFGASIFLLWQIYNNGGEIHQALFAWSMGILPLAYFYRKSSVFFLSVIVFILSSLTYIAYFFESSGWFRVNVGFSFAFLLAISYFFLGAKDIHKKNFLGFSKILAFFGLIGAFAIGNIYTFGEFIFFRIRENNIFSWELFFLTIGFLIFGSLLKAFSINKNYLENNKINNYDFGYFGFGALVFILSTKIFDTTEIYNLFYIFALGFGIYFGFKAKEKMTLNLSILATGIYVFGKYLKFAFENQMNGAIIFISSGALLILIAFGFEYVRKNYIKKM